MTSVSVSEAKVWPFVRQELTLEGEVVLDDAVVDQRQSAPRVDHAGGRCARTARSVGRPAGVPETVRPEEGMRLESLAQTSQLALGLACAELGLVHDHHTGGVVAAVLEAAQPVHQQRHDLLVAHVSNDAAHPDSPPSRVV